MTSPTDRRAATGSRVALATALAGVALAALTLIGCASGTSNGSSPGGSAPPIVSTPAPSATMTPPHTIAPSTGSPGCPSNLTVTPADNARALCVAAGGTVTIIAPPDQAQGWTPFDTSGTALTPATATPAATGSDTVLAAFRASAPGTSAVSSSHRNCPSPSPGQLACNSIALWRVMITVK
jgi:hypothetical protein